MTAPLAFAAGALGWTAAEYCLHRFVGHGPRRRRPASLLARLSPAGLLAEFNEEHLAHHADPRYFAPAAQKLAAAAAIVPAAGAVAALLVGRRHGLAFGFGLGAAYGAYEVLHRRIHTHAPRGRYGRWMRLHHLNHHYKTPRMNHGVTSPFWDRAVGTEDVTPAGKKLRVPAAQVPIWMADPATGAVRVQYAADYEIARRGRGNSEVGAGAA